MRRSLSRRSRNVGNDTTKKQTQDLLKQLKGALQAPRVLERKRATLLTLVTQILQNVSASQRLTKQDLIQIEQCARQTFDIIVTLQEPRSTGQSYLPAFIVQFFNARSFIGQLDSLQQDLTLTLQNVCSINENEVDSKSTSTQDEDPASSSTTHILDKDNLADLQDDLAILPAALQAIEFDLSPLHTEAQNLQRLTAPLQSRAEDFHLCWTSSSEDGELLRTSFKGLAMQLAVQLLIKNATIREVDLTYEPAGLARVEPQGNFGTPAAAVWKKKRVLSKHGSVARMQLQEITQLDRATQTWQNINHRNLVRLYGVRALESQVELIVEPCDFSLKEFLSDRDRELSLIEEETIMKGVARGLAHLHSHNILHQNLCPETVMCAKHLRSNIKLTDFGLCKHESSSMLAYTAPEIMGESPHWTQYADVYAFAMLCYEIKERQEPWVNEYPGTIIEEVQEGVRPSIGDDTAWKSRLLKIVTKAWSARIEERPSMAEIQRELEERIRDRRSTRVLQQMFGLGTTEEASHEYGQGRLVERASTSKVLETGERRPFPSRSLSDIFDAIWKGGEEEALKKKIRSEKKSTRMRKGRNHRFKQGHTPRWSAEKINIFQNLDDEQEEIARTPEEKALQRIFEEAGLGDKFEDALTHGFTIEAGKRGSHMELKAAGDIPMDKRFEIIKACQAYEPPSGDAESEQGSKRSSKSSYASSKVSEKSSTSEQDGEQDDYPPEHKPLHKIFVDLQIEDKFEDALTHGFSMEVGMAGSHVGLEEAGVSMGKRHHLIKACKAYGQNLKGERRSRKKSVIPSEDEIARDDAIVLEIFKKAKVPDKFEDAKIHGFSLAVGRTGSVQELKSAGVLRAERAAIIKLCQEYRDINSRASSDTEEEDENEEEDAVVAEVEDDEAEEDESNNHEETELPIATPDVDSEVLKILKEAGLEKYQANFSEHKFRTLKDCQKLDHTALRSMGVSTYTERAKALRVLRDSQN